MLSADRARACSSNNRGLSGRLCNQDLLVVLSLQLLIALLVAVVYPVPLLGRHIELLLPLSCARGTGADALIDQYVLLFLKEIWRYTSTRLAV